MPVYYGSEQTFTTLDVVLESFSDSSYERMRAWLPRFYSKRPGVIDEVLIAQGEEIDQLNLAIASSLEQAFARTASWTLDIWEHDLGLPLIPGFTTSQRQDRIVSQLRGTGTATPAVVRSVAEAYEQGDIEIIEDFRGYHITIRFSSTRGLPASLIDLQRALRAIIPAHLDVTYEFTYVRWDEVDAASITWTDTNYNNLTWGEWERTSVFAHAP